MKKRINKKIIFESIFILTIVLCFHILINSFSYMININKTHKIEATDETLRSINENMKKIDENMKKINKLDAGVYTKRELEEINKNLKTSYKEIRNLYILVTEKKEYKTKDIFDYGEYTILPYREIGNIIQGKNSSYDELLNYISDSSINGFFSNHYFISYLAFSSSENNIFSMRSESFVISGYANSRILLFKDFTDVILKVGEYDEK